MISIQKPGRFLSFLMLLVISLGIIIFTLTKLIWGTSQLQIDGQLVIAEGSTAGQIWEQLVDEGFTARATPWRYYAWRLSAASTLQSGSYELTVGETVPEVIQRLMTGDILPDAMKVTYPEGFTLDQIAARTAEQGISSPAEIIQNAQPSLWQDEFPFLADIPPGRDLEGYLFPDTYHFSTEAESEEIIQRLLATFARRVTPAMRAIAAKQGRTLDEIIIMASIIEREVISNDDMALVSGILWKRFDEGIGLAADATTRYALQKWDGPLTYQDLQSESPYNTRKWSGLPPGPISNPGLRAIEASLNPESSRYYYYLSTPQGETIFAATNDQHNANKAKYLR